MSDEHTEKLESPGTLKQKIIRFRNVQLKIVKTQSQEFMLGFCFLCCTQSQILHLSTYSGIRFLIITFLHISDCAGSP